MLAHLKRLNKRTRVAFRRLMRRPTAQATRWQRSFHFARDLTRHCWAQLGEDRALQMAAALTYHTIFGLVPLFVIAMIVFNAFGGFETVGEDIESRLYEYLGLTFEPGQVEQAPHVELAEQAEQQEKRQNIQSIISDLTDRVRETSFAGVSVVGVVWLIWAALGLVVTVEDCFNQVCRSTRGRAWHLRIPVYWAIITLGPVLAAVSLWMSGQVVGWVDQIAGPEAIVAASPLEALVFTLIHWGLDLLSRLAAFFATWVLLLLLYVLLPNATVKVRPAIIGALVAAVLWELAKYLFGLYIGSAVGYSRLYGSLSLIPLSLIWLFLTWLIVLFGLELTYTLQTLRGRRVRSLGPADPRDMVIDSHWIIPVMTVVGQAFDKGETRTVADIVQHTSLPAAAVAQLTQQLEKQGLLHRVENAVGNEIGYALARPPQQITAHQLLEMARSMTLTRGAARRLPGRAVLDRLSTAEHDAMGENTLADMLTQSEG